MPGAAAVRWLAIAVARRRDFAIDALQGSGPGAVCGPGAGEAGAKHREGLHLRDPQPPPTDVAAEFVAAGELIDLEDIASIEIPAIDVRLDDAAIVAVVHLDEVPMLYRFVDIQVHVADQVGPAKV